MVEVTALHNGQSRVSPSQADHSTLPSDGAVCPQIPLTDRHIEAIVCKWPAS